MESRTRTLETAPDLVRESFERLRHDSRTRLPWSVERRRTGLQRFERALLAGQWDLVEACSRDFGYRDADETRLAEVLPALSACRYLRKKLKSLARPSRRGLPWFFHPASAYVQYEPLGVVGIISPWNYPAVLALKPLLYAYAAGNRVILKPSERTPRVSAWLAAFVEEVFPPDEAVVVQGGVGVSRQVSSLPLDHLIFTGSGQTGRAIAKQAAAHLTPLTLELGGKCPTVIHESFPIADAARLLFKGKFWNAGQTCVAPDLAYVHESKLSGLVEGLKLWARKREKRRVPMTSMVDARHRDHVQGLLEDARRKGAEVRVLNGAESEMSPHLVLNTTLEMRVRQEEIFGPLLPVVTYTSLDQVFEELRRMPDPLLVYYFDRDRDRQQEVLTRTRSGGVCFNETLLSYAVPQLPFGGIGASGQGLYDGPEGFYAMSQKRSVYRTRLWNLPRGVVPPHGFLTGLMYRLVFGPRGRR